MNSKGDRQQTKAAAPLTQVSSVNWDYHVWGENIKARCTGWRSLASLANLANQASLASSGLVGLTTAESRRV